MNLSRAGRSLLVATCAALASCADDAASPPLLVRPVPAEYFLIGYAEEHDSARAFAAQCVLAGIVAFEHGTLDEYTGLGIAATRFLRALAADTDSAVASQLGPVRLARDPLRTAGGVLLEVPPQEVLPAVLEGEVDRDSTFRGPWPCARVAVTSPPGSGAPDTSFDLAGRWALCPDSATCSLVRPGSGESPPPVQFEFPTFPPRR